MQEKLNLSTNAESITIGMKKKKWRESQKAAREHLIDCQVVNLFLLKYVTITTF